MLIHPKGYIFISDFMYGRVVNPPSKVENSKIKSIIKNLDDLSLVNLSP
jgi:hypothetical protein